jgi:peptidoglycan/LPS O-acetylase OafA/YrhL
MGTANDATFLSSAKDHVAALDGLRFCAAIFVASAHYAAWMLPQSSVTDAITTLSGLGMTLFFALSGFVIHYNYGTTMQQPGGLRKFATARFSRLYPLYIVLFLFDFFLTYSHQDASCGVAGHPAAVLFALPYYLTLTQDWVFGVICKNNLIYQYGMMAQVSWSISAELFFYLVYCLYGRWAITQRPIVLFLVTAFGYVLLFAFITECFLHRRAIENAAFAAFGPIATEQNGYQDSLIRWLYYFWPISQLVHFIGGVAVAQAFMTRKPIALRGTLLVPLCLGAALATHFYLYQVIAPSNAFVGGNASSFEGPLVVLSIWALAIWPKTGVARLLSCSFIVKSGEASYSLYLLHAFLFEQIERLDAIDLHSWLLWAVTLVVLIGISRASYLLFERPVRNLLRHLLSTTPSPPAPHYDKAHRG